MTIDALCDIIHRFIADLAVGVANKTLRGDEVVARVGAKLCGGFLLAGLFVGRPYCRWFCPYGGIMAILSRVAWKNVSITPDKELDCGLCAGACPFGAIENLRADRADCLACARCYGSCPRELETRGLIASADEYIQVRRP